MASRKYFSEKWFRMVLWLVTLVVLGFSMAHIGTARAPRHWHGVALMPGMPPMPGMLPAPPGTPAPASASAPLFRAFPGALPPLGPPMPPRLWLDYLVRVLVMAAAAWLGARWLSRPVRRLTEASLVLSEALGRHVAVPELDERSGPVEVRQAAQVFNRMARQLSERFDERGLLMASISHDLRTPLTRLRMRLERLRPDPIAERCVADVNDVNALIEAVLNALNAAGLSTEAGSPEAFSAVVEELKGALGVDVPSGTRRFSRLA